MNGDIISDIELNHTIIIIGYRKTKISQLNNYIIVIKVCITL